MERVAFGHEIAMKVTVIPGRRLASEHVEAWAALQAADPALSSPFLSPEFTLAVAAARDDVYVGVLEDGGAPVGFFPHQRDRLAIGRPVGGCLNNLQGVIVDRRVHWDAQQVVRECGLIAWAFSRLLASQTPFERFHVARDASMFIDLSHGYALYAAEKSRVIGLDRLARKARKFERDAGELRFELQAADAGVLETLMRWKAERHALSGYADVYAVPWARHVIQQMHATQGARFGGVLSALYAGDEVAAVHMGLRARDLWHSWFIAYASRFARYSPGLLLYVKMAEHAASAGLSRIELGGGDYGYKRALMNQSIAVAEGAVDRLPGIGAVRKWGHAGADAIRQSPLLRPPARTLLRACRRVKHAVLHAHFDYERRQHPRL